MDKLLGMITVENFAMLIALYMVYRTTNSIEVLTKSIDRNSARLNSLISFLVGVEAGTSVDNDTFGDFMMKRLRDSAAAAVEVLKREQTK